MRTHRLPLECLDASSSPRQTPIRKFQPGVRIPVSRVGNGKGLCFLSFSPAAASAQSRGWSHGCSQLLGSPASGREESRAQPLESFGVVDGGESGRGRAFPEYPRARHGWGTTAERKYQQKPENATKRPAKNRRAGGDSSHQAQGEERLSLGGFHGWIQRDSTESHGPSGSCSLQGTCTSTSPHCHNTARSWGEWRAQSPQTSGRGGRGCGVREGCSLPRMSTGKLKIK